MADEIQPRPFARGVPVMPLVNATRPAPEDACGYPSARTGRRRKAEDTPSMAIGGMLNNAAPAHHSGQRGGKTTTIVAKLELVWLARRSVPEIPPSFTRGMRNNRVWSGITSRVSVHDPRIDAGKPEVHTICFDK